MADTNLLVRVPFGDYAAGDLITDPDKITALEDRSMFVMRVPAAVVRDGDVA